jgi:hypothetical protein
MTRGETSAEWSRRPVTRSESGGDGESLDFIWAHLADELGINIVLTEASWSINLLPPLVNDNFPS